MTMPDLPVRLTRENAIATITLNRPQAGNAIDGPLANALLDAAIICDEDPAIRCVLLTGAGRLFCAGGDIGVFAAAGEALPHTLSALAGRLHLAMSKLARMNKPLLVAVNGPAAGGGLSLALLGDIVIAAPTAHFSLGYTAIGLSPDGGATWLLPRLIGLRRAQELALLNARIAAPEAAAMGLITRVAPEGMLAQEAAALAQRLAESAVGAIGRTRALLQQSFANSLEAQMAAEARSISDAGRGAESREGINAFLQKRLPDFTT